MTEGAQVNNVQLVTRGRGSRDSLGDQPDLSQLISQSRNTEIISPDPGPTFCSCGVFYCTVKIM